MKTSTDLFKGKLHVIFLLTLLSCILINYNVQAQTSTENIRINQVGFFTDGIKKAIAIDFEESTFAIWTSDLSSKVYDGYMSKSAKWESSCEDNIQIADFSNFKHPGNYVVVIGDSKSYPFVISNQALDTVAKTQMKYFYFNRSGYELLPEYAGKWARKAGHMNTAVTVLEEPTRTINMHGGWYDAGDYGMYITTGAMAACQIMMSYEQFPEYWNKTEWNIPESGNNVPDILDEVKYELKWMYNMKDTDNGVWYKATSKGWPGVVMPHNETMKFYCMVKNATSAFDYAATFAFAARVYKKFETQYPGFADSCLTAAKEAWDWGVANETTYPGCLNPTGVVTGEYGDNVSDYGNDNKVLAGVELFITTGDSSYVKPIINTARNGFVNGEANWYEKRPVACMELALHGDVKAKNAVLEYANSQVEYQNNNAYNVNIGKTDYEFNWGSNRRVSNRGMSMMVAYILTKDIHYINGVTNSMDYILGRNATSYCFITGLGSKRVMDPHHRISGADGVADPQPGLPMQGPYYGNLGQCSPNIVSICGAKNYIDSECSYASNEQSIDQASPHVFNLGGLMQFLGKSISIELTSPTHNQILSSNSDIILTAEATTTASSITRVDFYNNTTLLHSTSSAPYTYTVTGLQDANYIFKAIAYNTENDSSIALINVTVGNSAPFLHINEPANHSIIAPNQNLNIQTLAYDLDGTISKVEFYSNSELIFTDVTAPFEYQMQSINAGDYNINVIAYDDKDATNTSELNFKASCENLITNGEFENDLDSWLLLSNPNSASITNTNTSISGATSAQITIKTSSKTSSDVQLIQPMPIKQGNKYYISYLAKADVKTTFECNVQHESDPWDNWIKHVESNNTLDTYTQLYAHEFTATKDDDSSKFKFFFGSSAETNVYFDKIEISLCKNELAEISSIQFSEPQVSISSTYTPVLTFENQENMGIQVYPAPVILWSSSNTEVAEVDATGKITAKGIGTAVITAKLASNQNIHNQITVTTTSYIGLNLNEQSILKVMVTPTIANESVIITADEQIELVQIISLQGVIIQELNCFSTQVNLNTHNLPSGIYNLKISSKSKSSTLIKIIKQ